MTSDRPAPRRPPGRYDVRRPAPAAARASGYAVVGILLLALAWFAYDRFSGGRLQVATLGYDVQDDTRVVVRFQVTKEPGATVRCRLQARDRAGAVVGDERVDVGPATDDLVRTSHALATTGRAATGEVLGCVVTDPPLSP